MGDNSDNFDAKTRAMITWDDVGAPLGRFLLIRKEKDICAVRFTEAHRGHDEKPQTILSSGEESLYAKYDWYYQGDGSGNFTSTNVKSGHDDLVRRPLIGIGRLAFQTGDIYVKCGTFKLRWMFPDRVAFYSTGVIPADYGIELAPSKWTDINEVRVQDSRLKWYRYDETRKIIFIPVDEL